MSRRIEDLEGRTPTPKEARGAIKRIKEQIANPEEIEGVASYIGSLLEFGGEVPESLREELIESVPEEEREKFRTTLNTTFLIYAVVNSVKLPTEEEIERARQRFYDFLEERGETHP